jgi:hypothetical protein
MYYAQIIEKFDDYGEGPMRKKYKFNTYKHLTSG